MSLNDNVTIFAPELHQHYARIVPKFDQNCTKIILKWYQEVLNFDQVGTTLCQVLTKKSFFTSFQVVLFNLAV
jgi:hypothetical protein